MEAPCECLSSDSPEETRQKEMEVEGKDESEVQMNARLEKGHKSRKFAQKE